eukprot:248581_1
MAPLNTKISMIFILTHLLIVSFVNSTCGYYENNPLDTCIKGKYTSNYFYCNSTKYIYEQQYGNGICSGIPSSDTPICNTHDTGCIATCTNNGSTGGSIIEPCPHISTNQYGDSPCNKATDDWQEEVYIMDYCHNVSVSGAPKISRYANLSLAKSAEFFCNAVGEIRYVTYTDDSCTSDELSVIVNFMDNLEGPTNLECSDTLFVSNLCNTTSYIRINSNIQCAYSGYKPLDVCEGHYGQPNYANYFYCAADGFLGQKAYGNSDCTGDPASDNPKLCDSRFTECETRCTFDKCDYFVQRSYVSGSGECDKTTDNWNEVIYPIGYCVNTGTFSIQTACTDTGKLSYKQYGDSQSCKTNPVVDIEIDLLETQPTVRNSGSCLDTIIYTTCPVITDGPTTYEPTIDTDTPTTMEPTTETNTPSTAPIVVSASPTNDVIICGNDDVCGDGEECKDGKCQLDIKASDANKCQVFGVIVGVLAISLWNIGN